MATLSEALGPVICAWCQKQLKVGDPIKPVSHGICLVCLGSVIDIPVEDVRHIPPEVLDVLPFGVIRLGGEGTITGYNKMESSFSGLDPGRIIGKNFFREIAPCASVKEFAGKLAKLRSSRSDGRTEFKFVFKFPRGAMLVSIVIVYDSGSDTAVILVKPKAEETNPC
jgi:photoactive yellow protein